MGILQLCDQTAATVPETATAADAIRVMNEHRVGAVAVLSAGGAIAGIFTERDVLKKLALSGRDPARTPVRELMTSPVETASADTTSADALTLMLQRHIRHLPIVDGSGKLLGVLSIRNLLQGQVEELAHQLDSLEQYVSNDGPGG
jgi:CBS domain-containing protein